MIIIEGPDGAGKTSLVKKLKEQLDLPIHERSANSDSSATRSTESTRGANLTQWAYHDVSTMLDQPLSIYDRHCLISEYIYGPIVRSFLDPAFLSPIMHLMIRKMSQYSLVIFCRPPDNHIERNVRADIVSREVVGEHSLRLAYGYDALHMFWPGDCITYDYTNPYSFANVMAASRIHVGRFNQLKASKHNV